MADYFSGFRDHETAQKLGRMLSSYRGRPVRIMEVCGTHTMAIFRYGIRSLLPDGISLVSGPGCPVCVTPVSYIDAALRLAAGRDVIITTFGDLMRVPGSRSSLLREKASGADIRVVYSPLDSLKVAQDNPLKKVVFLSVGFETTAPVSALSVLKAFEGGIDNFFMLSANKTMPEALKFLASDSNREIDGFIYPGHVSAVIGVSEYEKIAADFGIPGVVTGFEPLDILRAVISLVSLAAGGKAAVENQYSRFVAREGNPVAVSKMYEVFEPSCSAWRGIGNLPGSGLAIREKYSAYDAWKRFGLAAHGAEEPLACRCGDVLRGRAVPYECGLFGGACTPENPAGACMVSSEGTCAAYYRYGRQ